jgi:hypothetical protein
VDVAFSAVRASFAARFGYGHHVGAPVEDNDEERQGHMNDPEISSLMRAAAERQLAVAALQKKYEQSDSVPTEQLVRDMRELLATERIVLDAIITLFVKAGHDGEKTAE